MARPGYEVATEAMQVFVERNPRCSSYPVRLYPATVHVCKLCRSEVYVEGPTSSPERARTTVVAHLAECAPRYLADNPVTEEERAAWAARLLKRSKRRG